jgi:hypothetical protein
VGDGGRFAATGGSYLGEEVADVNVGRLLGGNERLADLRVLGLLLSDAWRDAARGWSRVPIDPCCSALPVPAIRHYYWVVKGSRHCRSK